MTASCQSLELVLYVLYKLEKVHVLPLGCCWSQQSSGDQPRWLSSDKAGCTFIPNVHWYLGWDGSCYRDDAGGAALLQKNASWSLSWCGVQGIVPKETPHTPGLGGHSVVYRLWAFVLSCSKNSSHTVSMWVTSFFKCYREISCR